jgi:Mrp family chromosome partitioning ATPase
MTIWEQAFSKQQDSGTVQVDMQSTDSLPDHENLASANTAIPQNLSPDSESFEGKYYQTAGSQSMHHKAQSREQKSADSSILENSRLTPRILSDNLSKTFPETLTKISTQLSDIWANILVETKQSVETLLVCGATRNEGGTFISFYLSMFLSKEYSMKVLYVDSNLNHAAVPNIRNLPGLYSFVAENKDISSLIVQTEYPGLYLLPSGAEMIAKNVGTNILSRNPIEVLMKFCRANFDMTIIDGQPLTYSPVMIEFAKLVDMTALVCRYGHSRREVSKLVIDKLQKFGVTSIGVILNDRKFPIPQSLYKIMG